MIGDLRLDTDGPLARRNPLQIRMVGADGVNMDVLELTAEPARAAPTMSPTVVLAGQTLDRAPDTAPDALVIDLERTGNCDPLRLCRETAHQSPATAIIGVGPEDRLADGFQLLRLGAVSWANGTETETNHAIEATLRGESVIAPRHAAWIVADFMALAERAAGADPRYNLTATEREVLVRLAKGQAPAEVAAFHDVGPRLVNHNVRLAIKRLHRHRHRH